MGLKVAVLVVLVGLAVGKPKGNDKENNSVFTLPDNIFKFLQGKIDSVRENGNSNAKTCSMLALQMTQPYLQTETCKVRRPTTDTAWCAVDCPFGYPLDPESKCPICPAAGGCVADPCLAATCGGDETCVTVKYPMKARREATRVSFADCRKSAPKAGTCPTKSVLQQVIQGGWGYSNCHSTNTPADECTQDYECMGREKCCDDGCQKKCMMPDPRPNDPLCLKLQRKLGYNKVHCCADGKFQEKQCRMSKRTGDYICWCVDKNTGIPLENTEKVGRTAASALDCSAITAPSCSALDCSKSCKFGYVYSGGCITCACNPDPCAGKTCKNNEICKNDGRCHKIEDKKEKDNRHGVCPKSDIIGTCGSKTESCEKDKDCKDKGDKCCSMGCEKVCVPKKSQGACFDARRKKIEDLMTARKAGCDTYITKDFTIPSCTPDGAFKKVQCTENTGMCWCVNPASGAQVSGFVRGTPDCCQNAANPPPALGSGSVCPGGEKIYRCSAALCAKAKCPNNPHAVCRVNPCGGCKVEFFDPTNNNAKENDCFGSGQCGTATQTMVDDQVTQHSYVRKWTCDSEMMILKKLTDGDKRRDEKKKEVEEFEYEIRKYQKEGKGNGKGPKGDDDDSDCTHLDAFFKTPAADTTSSAPLAGAGRQGDKPDAKNAFDMIIDGDGGKGPEGPKSDMFIRLLSDGVDEDDAKQMSKLIEVMKNAHGPGEGKGKGNDKNNNGKGNGVTCGLRSLTLKDLSGMVDRIARIAKGQRPEEEEEEEETTTEDEEEEEEEGDEEGGHEKCKGPKDKRKDSSKKRKENSDKENEKKFDLSKITDTATLNTRWTELCNMMEKASQQKMRGGDMDEDEEEESGDEPSEDSECKARTQISANIVTCPTDLEACMLAPITSSCPNEGICCENSCGSMQCKARRTSSGKPYKPKCAANGDYEPKQCRGPFCWCVRTTDGTVQGGGQAGGQAFGRDLMCDNNGVSTLNTATQITCPNGGNPGMCKTECAMSAMMKGAPKCSVDLCGCGVTMTPTGASLANPCLMDPPPTCLVAGIPHQFIIADGVCKTDINGACPTQYKSLTECTKQCHENLCTKTYSGCGSTTTAHKFDIATGVCKDVPNSCATSFNDLTKCNAACIGHHCLNGAGTMACSSNPCIDSKSGKMKKCKYVKGVKCVVDECTCQAVWLNSVGNPVPYSDCDNKAKKYDVSPCHRCKAHYEDLFAQWMEEDPELTLADLTGVTCQENGRYEREDVPLIVSTAPGELTCLKKDSRCTPAKDEKKCKQEASDKPQCSEKTKRGFRRGRCKWKYAGTYDSSKKAEYEKVCETITVVSLGLTKEQITVCTASAGSIQLEMELVDDPNANVDLAAAIEALQAEIESGTMTMTINGETFTVDPNSFSLEEVDEDDSGNGGRVGLIVGLVIGAIVFLVILAVFLYCLCKKSKPPVGISKNYDNKAYAT